MNTLLAVTVLVGVTIVAEARQIHRYVIKPIQIAGQGNLSLQLSEQFLDLVAERLQTGGNPNILVVLDGESMADPCHAPYVDCDVVNLDKLFDESLFPLRVDGSPRGRPKHGQMHEAICATQSNCWGQAIAAAAACIKTHHEVVHLGRRVNNLKVCSELFKHGANQ